MRASVSPSRRACFMRVGHGHQQLVAGIMAIGVVDGLEAIQVEIGHRQQLAAALRLHHGLVQAVGQQHAVGQVGQRIKVGNVFKLLLVLLERGDVGEQRHIVRDTGPAHHAPR